MGNPNIFTDYPVFIPILATLIAETLKLFITLFQEKRIRWNDFGRSGGMPSGHATLVASIVMTAFLMKGLGSLEFALSIVVAIIVIHDALKLRWEAGLHARIINKMIGKKKLEERLGHNSIEILTGIFLGFGIAFLLFAL